MSAFGARSVDIAVSGSDAGACGHGRYARLLREQAGDGGQGPAQALSYTDWWQLLVDMPSAGQPLLILRHPRRLGGARCSRWTLGHRTGSRRRIGGDARWGKPDNGSVGGLAGEGVPVEQR